MQVCMCQGVPVETKRQLVGVGSPAMWVHRDQTSIIILVESILSTKPFFIPANFFFSQPESFLCFHIFPTFTDECCIRDWYKCVDLLM